MFRELRLHQYSVLIALVILSVASTPIAWTTCPYVNGDHLCPQQQQLAGDEQGVDQTLEPAQSHCNQTKSHTGRQVERIDSQQTNWNVAFPAITPQRDDCSHCMMHSRSEANAPSRVAITNSSSDYSISPDLIAGAFYHQITNRAVVDVHEHGPPGSQGHRYLLNSTFRI